LFRLFAENFSFAAEGPRSERCATELYQLLGEKFSAGPRRRARASARAARASWLKRPWRHALRLPGGAPRRFFGTLGIESAGEGIAVRLFYPAFKVMHISQLPQITNCC
jgi:hypothetical protein